jgi:DinB superfamily
MQRPDPSEHAPYFSRYIDLVPEEDVVTALEKQSDETQKLLASLDEERGAYRYGPDKWSIKGVIGHVADGERIFGYRLLAIARGEKNPLPGFEENEYAETAQFDRWSLRDLAESLAASRRANLLIMRNLSDEDWNRRGVANNNATSARAIAFAMLGHERHHLKVLRERYLS